MKQLFLFFSIIALTFGFVSCSDDEELSMYGEKQDLVETEWRCINLIAGEISDYANILRIEDKEFTITVSIWDMNEEGQEVKIYESITRGTYEYKHPKINMVFEDGTETEAWISTRNNICFYEGNLLREYTSLNE